MGPEKDTQRHMAMLASHLEQVRRRVLYLLRHRPDAVDDCVQQTMLEAFQAAERNGPPDHPKSWLWRVAERVVFRNGAKIARNARHEKVFASKSPVITKSVLETVVRDEEVAHVHRALSSLPEHDRAAIEQHYWEDIPCKEIARATNHSATGIKSRLHRSRIELRRQMSAAEEERGR